MAFVLELQTSSTQSYIKNYIIAIIREFNINAVVSKEKDKIVCAFESEHENLQKCIDSLAQKLPASLFLKGSTHYETEDEPSSLPKIENEYPLNLALCPSCQKEMFDVSSRRYYYPFTACSCCGGNYSFFNHYPYERNNTSFKFIRACAACEKEINSVGLRENHKINSCHSCGVPVRLVNKTTERYANDAGSFRTMFEVAAKAIADDKKLLIKTTFGYRLFYKTKYMNNDSILMMINASKITDHLSLITEEFNALLSIERPVLYVTLKNEELKKQLDVNTAYVKYPDDGFSILLGAELQRLGVDFIAYEDADDSYDADMLMDYDLEVTPQKDMRLFINKDVQFIAEGERVSFPSKNLYTRSVLSVAHDFVGVPNGDKMLFDKMEHFDSVNVGKANVLDGITEKFHSNQSIMAQDEASFMSVIAEHNVFDKRCVGAYFDEEPSFLYYDTKNVLRIVPPKKFDAENLLQKISELREGSDRLVENLKKKMPETYTKLEELQTKDDVKLFEATAIILGLEDESMRGVTKEAMKFVGKGGIQIDTHVKDNRFDHIAFLSSIISYQLADVSSVILSYSIFESFGDYFGELIGELKSKTKAEEIILCGTHFANQSLFSRMQRNLKLTPPLMNINYPIGKENGVVGGVYL
jgi:hydrogenase maturation factor HypF (carbamoyltransferase family)